MTQQLQTILKNIPNSQVIAKVYSDFSYFSRLEMKLKNIDFGIIKLKNLIRPIEGGMSCAAMFADSEGNNFKVIICKYQQLAFLPNPASDHIRKVLVANGYVLVDNTLLKELRSQEMKEYTTWFGSIPTAYDLLFINEL